MSQKPSWPTDDELLGTIKRVLAILQYEKGIRDPDEVQELAQQIMLDSLQDFDPQRGTFKLWATKKTRWAFKNWVEKRIVERSVVMIGSGDADSSYDDEVVRIPEPSDFTATVVSSDFWERLIRSLDNLKGGDSMSAYILYSLQDLSPAQMAVKMGVDVKEIYKLQKRVFYNARAILDVETE